MLRNTSNPVRLNQTNSPQGKNHKFAMFHTLPDSFYWSALNSPVGPLVVITGEHALLRIEFGPPDSLSLPPARQNPNYVLIQKVTRQLEEYFAGQRTHFNLPLNPSGTPFQQKVWETLQRIPYGKLWSYGKVALELGNPKLSRAVGNANGKNPIPIIIPCHRVVHADGSLGGYSSGIAIKRKLLELEGIDLNRINHFLTAW